MIEIVLFVWMVSGVLNYGLFFGYLQRRFPNIAESNYATDKRFCILVSIIGPVALAAFFILKWMDAEPYYGFKWR